MTTFGFENCHCTDCRNPLPFGDDEWIDLGDGVEYQETITIEYGKEKVSGILLTHDCSVVDHCLLDIPFDIASNDSIKGPKWTINNLVPLDVSPSVVIKECGLHGFIRGGRWESTISKVLAADSYDYDTMADTWEFWIENWD